MSSKNVLYKTVKNPLLLKTDKSLPRSVAMIGAGTIGPDIGYYLKSALPDIKLYLVDVAEEPLKRAEKRLAGYTSKALEKGKIKEDLANKLQSNVFYTSDYNAIKDADLVIEAATENISLKQKIFAQVESIVGEDTIITSNTSSIPADRIFNKMKRPERSTVTHFFAPAWRSLPVEVITWEKVDQKVVDYLLWMLAATGKIPIMTDNAICFMLDRIFDNWCNEAGYLLSDATTTEIDHVAEEFVFAGPFYVLNMANGNPIIYETNSLQMEEGEFYKPSSIFLSVKEWLTARPGTKMDITQEKRKVIRDRLLGIVFSQSFDIVDRTIGTPEDLEFGCQVALGFRKGPFEFMRDSGEKEVDRIMQTFVKDRGNFPGPKQTIGEYQKFHRYVLLDDIEGVKVISIRRPQAMNAINDEMNDEIMDILKTYKDDPKTKGFVITGYGTQAFSAGADIGRFPQILGNQSESAAYARGRADIQQFMDKFDKPIVAALNGIAMGGGLELAIRCHSIVALSRAKLQFPEISLGILPGIGGCIVPYRKWPNGAKTFHEMLCLGKMINVKEAVEIGMVDKVADNYYDMIAEAVKEVNRLQGNIPKIKDGKVEIPDVVVPDVPLAGKLQLSKEAVSIVARTIKDGAATEKFTDALEIGYNGFGDIACTDAAKEGISAFLGRRQPAYTK